MTTCEELRYDGQGGDSVPATLVLPAGDPEEGHPAVLLVREVFGVDAHMRSLAERLAAESDPVRRVSLTFAVAGVRDELARSVLRERLELDELEPLERLYIASNLANLGPAQDVAPRLKRAALRATDPDERRGLQCLLWYWY